MHTQRLVGNYAGDEREEYELWGFEALGDFHTDLYRQLRQHGL